MAVAGTVLAGARLARNPELLDGTVVLALGATLALCFVPVAAVVAGTHRYRRTGQWPLRRAAPWAMFWVLPVLGLAALITSVGALGAMIASIEVTSSGPC